MPRFVNKIRQQSSDEDHTARTRRRADALLVLAVIAAITIALAGVVRDPHSVPDGAVALVNGRPLSRAAYDALLQQLQAQLGHVPSAQERAEVLRRLIDEELLLQQGLALDLLRADSRMRSQLVQEVIRHAVAGVADDAVSSADLETFYAANRDYFARRPLLHARRYRFSTPEAARDFASALVRDGAQAALLANAAARDPLLPDSAMPESKLRDYLGSDVAARLAGLAPGQILTAQQPDGSAVVLILLDKVQPGQQSLEAIRPQIESEFRRRRDEQALADYVKGLREESRIVSGDGE